MPLPTEQSPWPYVDLRLSENDKGDPFELLEQRAIIYESDSAPHAEEILLHNQASLTIRQVCKFLKQRLG